MALLLVKESISSHYLALAVLLCGFIALYLGLILATKGLDTHDWEILKSAKNKIFSWRTKNS